MALQFVSDSGTLTIPQANAQWITAPSNAGIATRGVVVLVGEADLGASYVDEADGFPAATFGPGQYSAVAAKYGSGALVDAYRNVVNPSRDPSVRGAPAQIICIKTNQGAKALGAFSAGYAVARAKSAGLPGNLLSVQVVSAAAEVTASITESFVYFVAVETVKVAANGGTAVTLDSSSVTPAAFVAANVAALAVQNVALTGGVNAPPANGLVACTVGVGAVGNVITITLTGGIWATQPAAGATLVIANASSITGAGNANSGQYVVTSATPATIVATKLVDAGGVGLTPPVAVAPGAAANAGMADAYSQVVFTNAAATVQGEGDSLTWYRDPVTAGLHYYSATAVAVTTGFFATSATEATVSILVNRSSTNLSETLTTTGNVVLSVGHVGVVSTLVTVNATSIILAGGVTLTKSAFATLGDVVAYINAQPNWYASVPAAFKSLSPSVLDYVAVNANQNGVTSTGPARIKKDAYDVVTAIGTSAGIELVTNPTVGYPVVQAVFFLAGGLRGGTTDTAITAALEAAGTTQCNFVVTLFSRDATSDIADGLTDAASTYTIDGCNASLAAHVSKYSQFKRRRPRQGFASKRGTFAVAKTAAQTLANFRLAMAFQDVAALGANGTVWFQPWMVATLAAGMQAAAFYRPIFNKSIGVTGVLQAALDFKTQDDDAVEQALLAGLLVIRARTGGGFSFVSDQTTYATDSNFVYNSIQAVYVADVVAQTVAQNMEAAFVGQSFADITASVALSYLKGVMANLRRLKLIATSDDAVDGYRNAKIVIQPPAMLVSAELKLATGLYFVPISFLVSEVIQTASQG